MQFARCDVQRSAAEIEGPAVKREKPDFRCFVSSLTIVRRASTEKKEKEKEEESNARKTMLHFSTLEIDPIRLKFQSSKKGEPLSQLQSICNAARTVTGDISLHFITIRYRYRGRN